jgi:hypothetical protein
MQQREDVDRTRISQPPAASTPVGSESPPTADDSRQNDDDRPSSDPQSLISKWIPTMRSTRPKSSGFDPIA